MIKLMTASTALATLLLTSQAIAGPDQDCVLEGTVQKQKASSEKVYVAFHSYKAAEKGADCHIRKGEKLEFKQPVSSDIQSAKPGTKVEYRYTRDQDEGQNWELINVSS